MKLLLVNPHFTGVVIIPSFGLGYIGTYIRDKTDWDVEIVESINRDTTEAEALDKAMTADIVGLICYTESRFQCFRFAQKVKAFNPSCTVVVGGPHVNALDQLIIKYYPFVDIVVRMEGEEAMRRIVIGESLGSIPGITWRNNGEVVQNPDHEFIKNIDSLQYDYDLAFPKVSTWKDTEVSDELQKLNHIPLIASRGCPFHCSFCAAHPQWNGTYRGKGPDSMLVEIQRLIDTYNSQYFRFYDALFIGNESNILRFCDCIEQSGIKIHFRIDIRIGTKPAVLERLRKVGCDVLGFGVETGSDRILKRVNKRITRAQVIETVKTCKSMGFWLIGFFMVAHPDETFDDVKQTFELFEDLDNHNLQFYKIHPNTTFYEELKERGEINDNCWFNPEFGANTVYGNEFYYCKELFPSATFMFEQAHLIASSSPSIFKTINIRTNSPSCTIE